MFKVIIVESVRCNGRRMCFSFNIIDNGIIMRKRINRSQIAVIFVSNIPERHFKSENKVINIGAFINRSEAMENRFAFNFEEENCNNVVVNNKHIDKPKRINNKM